MRQQVALAVLLLAICVVTSIIAPAFCLPYNLENLLQRSALFGIISIGAVFVILTGGIDLSIGSVVGLIGSLLPLLLVERGWSVAETISLLLGVSVLIGLIHGLLVTRLRLQPFVVTLCGLLTYRGLARWITDDRTLGFGSAYDEGLRQLAIAKPFSVPLPFARWISEGNWGRFKADSTTGSLVLDTAGDPIPLDLWTWIRVPLPFLILIVVAVIAAFFLHRMAYGRYIIALGRSEEAARYSGIPTERMVVLSYILCSLLGGIGAILFTLDNNLVQPAGHGNFYELDAIAAAVLGGCSLRGGRGSVVGAVIGAALMRVLYNSMNLVKLPTQLHMAVIGIVILGGVMADAILERFRGRRRG
jgi:ribose transport system permease protein